MECLFIHFVLLNQNMKNYNKLKQVIQEANPEIMELKRGCRITIDTKEFKEEVEGGIYDYFVINNDKWKHDNRTFIDVTIIGGQQDGWDSQLRAHEMKKIEIFGRPIRLADVLLAMGKEHFFEHYIASDGDHALVYKTVCENEANEEIVVEPIAISWNLKNNSLDNQSDETKQFLIDLLVT